MQTLVEHLKTLPQTGSCSIDANGNLACSSSIPSSLLQVFDVSNWQSVRNINSLPDATTVVLSVRDKTVDFKEVGTSSISKRNVIFYFPDAIIVRTSNVKIYGGFLAPNADVSANDGDMFGWIYTKSNNLKNWKTAVRAFTMSCEGKFEFLVNSTAYYSSQLPLSWPGDYQ